jgi:uncharacterized protein (TIGR02757 family)
MPSSPARPVPSRPRWARQRPSWKRLGETLRAFDERFPKEQRRRNDPVEIAHGYRSPRDQEVAALVAACLAFGRVAQLMEKARAVLSPFGEHPADAIAEMRERDMPAHLVPIVHRWVDGKDLAVLLRGVGRVVREHGSLGEAFRSMLAEDDSGDHLLGPITRFATALSPARRASFGARYLLGVPSGASAAKRWCLYLRWMARPADGVDLGLWPFVGTRRLTIPLDTHVARIGAYVGLTDRRTPGWLMAREITTNLARFSPDDPTRYDFALSHLGIMGGCPRRRNSIKCAGCDLVTACRL